MLSVEESVLVSIQCGSCLIGGALSGGFVLIGQFFDLSVGGKPSCLFDFVDDFASFLCLALVCRSPCSLSQVL